ncbi:MAG: ferredoxin reductase [Gemmatimonadaceae bacterium]
MTDSPDEGDNWQEAVIEEVADETPTVKSFVLRPRLWHPFLPGQHVDVRLTAPDGYQARRSYSVTSDPERSGVFQLAVERLEEGEVSPFFHDVAQVGDTVEVRRAFAEHFAWQPEPGRAVLLIGGGSGVAPLMSMVRHRAHARHAGPMVLLYSARTWDDVIFREELLAQERSQPDLRVVLCLTRAAPQRPTDHARRIDAEILRGVLSSLPEAPHLTFVCGANPFVGTVADLLVGLGLPPSTIRTERFGG